VNQSKIGSIAIRPENSTIKTIATDLRNVISPPRNRNDTSVVKTT